jgi:ankyrin repeat protein
MVVVLDSEQDTFRFAHLSVREYLDNSWDSGFCHAWIFEQCIYGYFSYPEDRSLSYLYDYSAKYGPLHHTIHHNASADCRIGENLKQWLRRFFFQTLSFPKWIINSYNAYKQAQRAVSPQPRGQVNWGHTPGENAWRQTVKCLLNRDLSGELQRFIDRGSTCDAEETETKMKAMLLKLVVLDGAWEIMESDYLTPYIARLRMDNLTLFMLRMGADINDRDLIGRGVLTYAINARNDGMILKLIDQGADCLARDSEGVSDLHMAARTGYDFDVQQILNTGVSVNSSSAQNNTPLMTAAANGQASIVKLLLEKGADIRCNNYFGQNALHVAVPRGDISTIKLLVDADVPNIDITDNHQSTALHLAAHTGDPEIISVLLYAGSDFSRNDRYGQTPVQIAACYSHTHTVMLLLEEERDPERKIERTTIAFNTAANNGQIALVWELSQPSLPISDSAVRAILLSFGNKLYIKNFFATAELLVGTLENINAHNEASETILHQAVNDYAPILIIILLRFGANTEVRNNYGETALHLAAKRGPSSSVVLLLDAGANTKATTYDRAYTRFIRQRRWAILMP